MNDRIFTLMCYITNISRSTMAKRSHYKNLIVKKSSEPVPLSTLLLDTVIPLSTVGSSTTATRSTSRVSSDRSESDSNLNFQTPKVPVKNYKKGFMGRIRNALGVRAQLRFSSVRCKSDTLTNTCGSDTDLNVSTRSNTTCTTPTYSRQVGDDEILQLLEEARNFLERTCPQDGESYRDLEYDSKFLDSNGNYGRMMPVALCSQTSLDDLFDKFQVESSLFRTETRKMSYYCPRTGDNDSANREILQKLVEDFMCVVNKLFGTNDKLKCDCSTLLAEIDRLRKCCDESDCIKNAADRKIQELLHQIQQLQYCLEEECQARKGLESLVQELKAQLGKQDGCLNNEIAEKADLMWNCKQYEVDTQGYLNQIADLEAERDALLSAVRNLEGSKGKCSDLQRALAECCEQCDRLQKELFELRKKYREMESKLDKVEFENSQLLKQLECERQRHADEKCILEGEICKLLEAKAAVERSKLDVCQRTNEILKQHHDEMNKLSSEADKYKGELDGLRKAKEDLEKRLRESEEQRRKEGTRDAQGSQMRIDPALFNYPKPASYC